MVPGIAPTADPSAYPSTLYVKVVELLINLKVLQARMFAYPDAARYRLGVNYQQLPCNAPVSPVYTPYLRDGVRHDNNFGGDPNYVGSKLRPINFKGRVGANGYAPGGHEEWVGQVASYASEVTDEDFIQSRELWKVMGKTNQQKDFVHNVSSHLKSALPEVQAGTISKLISPLIHLRHYSVVVLTRSTRNVCKSRSGTRRIDQEGFVKLKRLKPSLRKQLPRLEQSNFFKSICQPRLPSAKSR
jgi:hypothetical protein